jgi:hypothetical protein
VTNVPVLCRQCIFQGNLEQYIWEISFVYFTIIRNTVSCFQACFPPPMMSACVKWAMEEVDAFNAILARQLSGEKEGSETWTRCMNTSKDHAGMLAEVGMDFRNLVGQNIKPAGGDAASASTSNAPAGLGLILEAQAA